MQSVLVVLFAVVLVEAGVIVTQNILFHREREFWHVAFLTRNLPQLTLSKFLRSQKNRQVYAEDIKELTETERIAAPKAPAAPVLGEEETLSSEEEDQVEWLRRDRGMGREMALKVIRGEIPIEEANLVAG
jgi:hypothetical protein